ncbi:MAG: LamG domain-containing protein [bacterium]
MISAPLAELGVRVVVGNVPTTVASTLGVGLVAHYKMNDNLGTTVVLDNKGSYNGTSVRNTDQLDTTGKINGALSFVSANSDQILATDGMTGGSNPFSIAFWLKDSLAGTLQTIISFGSGGYNYIWNANTNKLVCDSGLRTSSATPYNDGAWHHWVFVNNSGVGQFYRDGITDGSPGGFSYQGSPTNIWIGSLTGNSGYFLNGQLDDVRIYNRALSAGEVAALYNGGYGTEAE